MIVKPGDEIAVDFTTTNPATGALANADSLPTGTLIRNGSDTAESVVVANKATGRYTATATIPASYAAGDIVEIYVAATVATVAGGAVVWSASVQTRRIHEMATLGAGAVTFVYTVTNSVDSQPIPGVDVWVTTDEAGTNVVARGTTDAGGEVTFYLDAGTAYFWRQLAGWTFTNPDTEVVG